MQTHLINVDASFESALVFCVQLKAQEKDVVNSNQSVFQLGI